MRKYYLKNLSAAEEEALTKRPEIQLERVIEIVKPVLADIRQNGLAAAVNYAQKLDGYPYDDLRVKEEEFEQAEKTLDEKIKTAIKTAAGNIETFHKKQIPDGYTIETMPGVECSREFRPVENAGLYIPGGSAVLPSTMLMLGIPARLAGCKRVIACSPSKDGTVNAPLLYAARLCGVNEFYKIGGAQAIALMAYGAEGIKKVNKIFGPGNQFVTAAKMLLATDFSGCAIDMPAGPSEVLAIADSNANPAFIASDLLSQAEHGADSQVVLATVSEELAQNVSAEIDLQLKALPRMEFAIKALEGSFILITETIRQAVEFSNNYAPEHLILHVDKPDELKDKIINAGSVFMGGFSPESAGDYASGTNHSLPTYGYAKNYSGVNVGSFLKSITFQKLTKAGLENIAQAVETLAETEGLYAHKNAVTIRLKS
jgi:histidinol dehydrogenase